MVSWIWPLYVAPIVTSIHKWVTFYTKRSKTTNNSQFYGLQFMAALYFLVGPILGLVAHKGLQENRQLWCIPQWHAMMSATNICLAIPGNKGHLSLSYNVRCSLDIGLLWHRYRLGDNGILQRTEFRSDKSIHDVDRRRPFTWHCLHRSNSWVVLASPLNSK